jgi:hypothetical protein
MLNKKIASEVAVGVILLVAITLGAVFWINDTESGVLSEKDENRFANPITVSDKIINNQKNNMIKDITLKAGESTVFEGLMIKNTGGGHGTSTDGRDTPFANVVFKFGDNKEEPKFFYLSPSKFENLNEDYRNGFRISIKEVGWNGEFVGFAIENVGEPKITENEALAIVGKYLESKKEDVTKSVIEASHLMSDKGSYYLYTTGNAENLNALSFRVDKFSKEIVDVTENKMVKSKVD